MKILLVEDNSTIAKGLVYNLEQNGYEVRSAETVIETQKILEKEKFDLIILDISLPDGNGFDLCREFKAAWPELPVIFLTANDLETDVLNGFDMGAEDYVTKPFNMKILMRRVEVALRRNTAAEQPFSNRWSDGFLTLDFSKLTAVRGDEKIIVTSNEYKLLKALIENAGNILTRQNLLERLWDIEGNFVDDHALTATINRLRAKIEDETHSYIKTVRGMGYAWMGAAK